ncbi:adenosine deaminase [Fontibacillus solani]|uniref:Adenosine deaminase n=1 Tax=Fontibacillus solani TaxID=1572857 RepID=A0A7W3SRD2_9BACL|nr:adenosine deaminase [Fontibacillus solani]MBA9084852.1 adenosine deaminase [Fontibacillus solani]
MGSGVDKSVLRRLPKIDLHLHLDGSVRPQTLLELAEAEGLTLPAADVDRLLPFMRVEGDCPSLVDYLSKFDLVLPAMQTAYSLERIAYEVVEQAAEHNCKYIEVRMGARLHLQKGLSLDEVIESFVTGLRRGEATYGVKARGIIICMRNHAPQDNLEVIEAAARFMERGVVAVDLAGPEDGFPPELHLEVFDLAKKHGLPFTIHAGEAAGADSIYGAVVKLGTNRIGHGVRLKEDRDLLERVRAERIPLEFCPISNIQTKASTNWETYPIREYFDQGLLITVNTDNLTVSDTNMTKELAVLADHFQFTLPEMEQIMLNSVEAAFLEKEEKRQLHEEIVKSFAELL